MNTRRNLVLVLGITSLLPRVSFAQAKKPSPLIGWLNSGSRESNLWQLAAFKEGLAALGYKEGQHFVIEERWANARLERLQPLAEELAAMKPVVFVASASPAVAAAAKAAPSTPVVQGSGGDPVESGLVKSFARPGGMITGLSNAANQTQQKYFELLVAAVPKVRRIGVLADSANTVSGNSRERNRETVRRWAAHHSIEVHYEEAASPDDIEPAMERLAKQGVQGLVMLPSGMLSPESPRVAKAALARRWPLVLGQPRTSEGWLISFNADNRANFRRAAYYVEQILKGTKPGDLPIEQPMTFDLVVNLKTAKQLGLTLPPEIMVQATKVIE